MNDFWAFLEAFKNNPTVMYIAVFLVSFLESFVIVGEFVPGAFFIVGSGYVASRGVLNIYLTVLFAVLGAILADIVSYILALKFYSSIKDRPFIGKFDKVMEKGIEFFKKHGGKSVFLGRFVGALRPIVPFIAGIFGMDKGEFMFWAVLSGVLWGVSYVGLGYFFGNNWHLIKNVFKDVNIVVAAIALLALVVYFLGRKFNRD